jgi:hypothetical protein
MEGRMNNVLRARLPRFSLRAVFFATTLAAIYLGFAAWKDAERTRLIASIEAKGGVVTFDDTLGFAFFASEQVAQVTLPMSAMADLGTKRLRLFNKLATIEMTNVDMFVDEDTNVRAHAIRLHVHSAKVLEGLDESLLRSKRIARDRQQMEDRQNTSVVRE